MKFTNTAKRGLLLATLLAAQLTFLSGSLLADGNAEAGQEKAKLCEACHGADGKAEVIVLHMDTPPKDQSDPVYMKTLPDAYLYLAICRGGLGVGKNFIMPAWGDLLSDQDIKDLVAQIRTFSGT